MSDLDRVLAFVRSARELGATSVDVSTTPTGGVAVVVQFGRQVSNLDTSSPAPEPERELTPEEAIEKAQKLAYYSAD